MGDHVELPKMETMNANVREDGKVKTVPKVKCTFKDYNTISIKSFKSTNTSTDFTSF